VSAGTPPPDEPAWLKRLAGVGDSLIGTEERRRARRYEVTEPAQVTADGLRHDCEVINVSSGGAYLAPALDLPIGTVCTLTHPSSTASVSGHIVGKDEAGTHIAFDDPTSGVIVSAWIRAS